jgi:tubulin polyglutamylase TTLL1
VDDYHRHPTKKWIVKPAGSSQGKGIFLIHKITQLKQLSNLLFRKRNDPLSKENFVVSRYVDNPLLISGKKFDLRLYYLVTNYRPLKVWKSSRGFARFCQEEYDNGNIEEMFGHLTNTSLQKNGSNYNS